MMIIWFEVSPLESCTRLCIGTFFYARLSLRILFLVTDRDLSANFGASMMMNFERIYWDKIIEMSDIYWQ